MVYLGLHPDVSMSARKETNFFLRADFAKAVAEYEHMFDDAPGRGEVSPRYAMYPTEQDVPLRMQSLIPDAKLGYLVRDPVDRAEAHYHEIRCKNRGASSLEEAFADPEAIDNECVCPSRYTDFARTEFDRELNTERTKIRITAMGERARVADRTRRAQGALAACRGAPVHADPAPVPARRARQRLPQQTRQRVAAALKDDVARPRVLTGREFDHWSV